MVLYFVYVLVFAYICLYCLTLCYMFLYFFMFSKAFWYFLILSYIFLYVPIASYSFLDVLVFSHENPGKAPEGLYEEDCPYSRKRTSMCRVVTQEKVNDRQHREYSNFECITGYAQSLPVSMFVSSVFLSKCCGTIWALNRNCMNCQTETTPNCMYALFTFILHTKLYVLWDGKVLGVIQVTDEFSQGVVGTKVAPDFHRLLSLSL